MSIVEKETINTANDWLELEDRKRFELVDGQLVERNMSGESSRIAMCIGALLATFVARNRMGSVYGSDCGYKCFGDTTEDSNRLRLPDVSFIKAGRISQEQDAAGYLEVVPDLAVEVVSPNDLAHHLNEKIDDYLRAGIKLVWVIDPGTKTVEVHRPDGSDSRLRKGDQLSGEDVIPGFECQVENLFPEVP